MRSDLAALAPDVDLVELWRGHVERSIDAEGVYPAPLLMRNADGGLVLAALACPPSFAGSVVRAMLASRPRGLVFGLDRFTKPGQGAELADLVAGAHWDGKVWRPLVLEYRHQPRLVKPVDWGNVWWATVVRQELLHVFGPSLSFTFPQDLPDFETLSPPPIPHREEVSDEVAR